MPTLRRLTIAIAALVALALATPARAQDNSVAPGNHLWPSFAPELTDQSKPEKKPNQQGLGVFLQGGWVRVTQYGANGLPAGTLDTDLQGWLVGIAFGGNKSGAVGVGVDINYMVEGNNNSGLFVDGGDLSLHYVDIPVYARINTFGHATKNKPTLYFLVGGFVDILLTGSIDSVDIKDQFNGFDTGVVGGVGFEAARLGVELRGNWSLQTLQSTGVNHNGQNTFKDGLSDSKKLTMMLLFRLRLN